MYNIIFILLSLFTTRGFANELAKITQSQRAIATQADQEQRDIGLGILRKVSSKIIDDHVAQNAASFALILILSNIEFHFQKMMSYSALSIVECSKKEDGKVITVVLDRLLF